MHKFMKIGALHQAAKWAASHKRMPDRSPVAYRGTVKLHGTNAGVIVDADGLRAQSRSRIITPEDDNYGFAAHIAEPRVTRAVLDLAKEVRRVHGVVGHTPIVLYGEWVGPGIQSGVAVCNLHKKQWVLFGTKIGTGESSYYTSEVPKLGYMYSDGNVYSIADVETFSFEIDYDSPSSRERAVQYVDQVTKQVETVCPWGERFGIAGTGEGIVWSPTGRYERVTDLYFKSKGAAHRTTKPRAKKQSVGIEKIESVDRFVDYAVTDVRLRQGVDELREKGHAVAMESMGAYLKWIGNDVRTECAVELDGNGLTWQDVSRAVARRARDFFVSECVSGASLCGQQS